MKKLANITLQFEVEVDNQELVDAQGCTWEEFHEDEDLANDIMHDYVVDHSDELLSKALETEFDVLSVELKDPE